MCSSDLAHSDTNFAAGAQYASPGLDHWLGTDGIGRDWYSRLVYGTQTSMRIGIFAALITLAIKAGADPQAAQRETAQALEPFRCHRLRSWCRHRCCSESGRPA